MKKVFILLFALASVSLTQATKLMNEHFDRTVGNLHTGDANTMGDNTADWWYTTTSSSSNIQVLDTNLTRAGYQTDASGKAIRFAGTANKDVRGFNAVTVSAGTKVFYSLLLNVHKPKNSTIGECIVSLLPSWDAAAASNFAQLRVRSTEGYTTYRLGVGKASEPWIRYTSQELQPNTTYLVVVGYEAVDGEKNDIARLWINPTNIDEANPTLICNQDSMSSGNVQNGAKGKADAASLGVCKLSPGTNTPTSATIDELRVATRWADLFEASSGAADFGVPDKIEFGAVFAGESLQKTFTITGSNLTQNVTLAKTSTELALSTTAIAPDAANAGFDVKVTLNPAATGAHMDNIVVTSGTVTKNIAVSWTTIIPAECANIAALKKAASEASAAGKDTLLRFTGSAIVTRDTLDAFFIEDASAAIRIDNAYNVWPATVNVGDKITGFRAVNGANALGIQALDPQSAPTVQSSGNKVVPQIVSLAALQSSPAEYLLELVTVEGVTFETAAEKFSVGDFTIKQSDKSATLKVESGIGLVGVKIPEKANVTGFSFNKDGNIIVPRGAADIVNKSAKLLGNGGFEEFTTGTASGLPTTEYADWSFSGGGWAAGHEATDKIEGANAFLTTEEFKIADALLSQTIDMTNFNTDDEFELRINYKVLTPQGDNSLSLASCWASATEGDLSDDEAKLKVALDNSSSWKQVKIRTKKPAKATKFEFRLSVKKQTILLLDDFAFEYVEPENYFSVLPESVNAVQTNVNTEVLVANITIRQKGLTQPVNIGLGGDGKAMFKIDKTQATASEEVVKITYAPTAAGHHEAMLSVYDDESPEISLFNRTIKLEGTAIDPSKTPTITINPTSLPKFSCQAKQKVSDTINVTSENCTDFINVKITNTQGSGFLIDGSLLSKNVPAKTIVTFSPLEAGDFAATIEWSTEGGQTVSMNVTGSATEAPEEEPDYATEFVWNTANPLNIMQEGFDKAGDFYNKTLSVDGWQNVVTAGERAWWGYKSDTTSVAKATGYIYQGSATGTEMVTWLVTPALNFKTPNAKQFGFRVMGEIIFDGQEASLQVYYVDPSKNPVQMTHISTVDSLIPANDADLEGKWFEVVADLTGQSVADVFFIAFRFRDKAGSNGATYQLDDVSWGVERRKDEAVDNILRDDETHKAQLLIRDGNIYLRRDGKTYTIHGKLID